ncbi:hypothetical protein WJX72_007159 [[Myrmecia] bisecta]|uniref:Uncharacterized protein n=1 Tax=[Myrmecia] bisecta TaxID=41462 RepID=A0AAW1PGF6_9CHLO
MTLEVNLVCCLSGTSDNKPVCIPHSQPQPQNLQAPAYPAHAPAYPGSHPGIPQCSYNNAVVDAMYCRPHEMVFLCKEAKLSLSGDDFTAYDTAGKKWYQMDSSALSVTGRRVLYDEHAKGVISMKRKLMSAHKTWTIHRGSKAEDSQLLCQVKLNKVPGSAISVSVFLAGNTSSHFSTPVPDYAITGDTKMKSFFVCKGQQPAAEIARKLAAESARLRYLGKDQYAVKVLPNFDHVFILGLVVAVDELYFD